MEKLQLIVLGLLLSALTGMLVNAAEATNAPASSARMQASEVAR